MVVASTRNPLILQNQTTEPIFTYELILSFGGAGGAYYTVTHTPTSKRFRADGTWLDWIREHEEWETQNGIENEYGVRFLHVASLWEDGIEPIPDHLKNQYGVAGGEV